jgi:hypothetical protein
MEKDDLLILLEAEAQVKEVGNKKIAELYMPVDFQGHTFAIDFNKSCKYKTPNGSFRIEYILCNEFIVYLDNIEAIDTVNGFSNLKLAGNLSKTSKFELFYYRKGESLTKNIYLMFKTQEGLIQRLIIEIKNEKIDEAIKIANSLISGILDIISFQKEIPLKVRQIEIYQLETEVLLRRYVTIPYFVTVDLEEKDIIMAADIPKVLEPCLRLFREAINSTSPHYRLLCLYRVKEGLKLIQDSNAQKMKERGAKIKRTSLKVPKNNLTCHYFPNMIGKSVNVFFDHVYQNYRNQIAHLKNGNYENMLLDPADVRTDHRIDYINAILIIIIRQMIENEWNFMKEQGLK